MTLSRIIYEIKRDINFVENRDFLGTCESEISVRIESRIESADSSLQLQC